MQISRQHIDANGSMTYQLSDPPDRTLHLQSLGTMILKIISFIPAVKKKDIENRTPMHSCLHIQQTVAAHPMPKAKMMVKIWPSIFSSYSKSGWQTFYLPPKPANECFLSSIQRTTAAGFFPTSSATMSCALTTISNPFLHASILADLCQSPGPTFPSGMCLQTLKQRNDVIKHVCWHLPAFPSHRFPHQRITIAKCLPARPLTPP